LIAANLRCGVGILDMRRDEVTFMLQFLTILLLLANGSGSGRFEYLTTLELIV
jgi:hypothetical protein